MRKKLLLKLINYWPPFLGAGVNVTKMNKERTSIDVELNLKFWNKNIVGTHFGGSLYAMTDPFFMLILMENLGPDYIVWDKAATIRFKRPGKGKVHAHFHIPKSEIDKIREDAQTYQKVEPVFTVNIKDHENNIIAEVEKTLYVRRKDKR